MSSTLQYYNTSTQQLLSSKFIYKNSGHMFNLKRGSIAIEKKSLNAPIVLAMYLLTRKKPNVLASLAPSKLSLLPKKPKRSPKCFYNLKGYSFNWALHAWVKSLKSSHTRRTSLCTITPTFIKIRNDSFTISKNIQANCFLRAPSSGKNFVSERKHVISLGLHAKTGTVFSKIFFLNTFNFFAKNLF